MTKILLVDDDPDMLDITSYALRREGFNVVVATNGVQALRRMESDPPDLVLLDVKMPRMNGFDVCQKIRQSSDTPVILLTAASDEDHVVQGFSRGADDYVTKPFSPKQLSMRIRAIVQRTQRSPMPKPVTELKVGDMVIDVESHQVRKNGEVIQLTPLEFRNLYMLASNCGHVVSFSRLVEYAWGYDGGDPSMLKTHICHIRKKLNLKRGAPNYIGVVPGVGYYLSR